MALGRIWSSILKLYKVTCQYSNRRADPSRAIFILITSVSKFTEIIDIKCVGQDELEYPSMTLVSNPIFLQWITFNFLLLRLRALDKCYSKPSRIELHAMTRPRDSKPQCKVPEAPVWIHPRLPTLVLCAPSMSWPPTQALYNAANAYRSVL